MKSQMESVNEAYDRLKTKVIAQSKQAIIAILNDLYNEGYNQESRREK